MSDPLAVTGLGVTCPVGLDAALACAAIRAGVSRFAEDELYFPLLPEGVAAEAEGAGEPEPVLAARVPVVPPDLAGRERLMHLALAALQGVVSDGGLSRQAVKRCALGVALPAEDPGVVPWAIGADFAQELCRRAGVDGWAATQVVRSGPVGVVQLVSATSGLFANGKADACLLLAVDTLVDRDRLMHLDGAWRLRSRRNPDGLIPGEAAVALLLEPLRSAERRKAPVLGLVGPFSASTEPVTVSADRWSTGSGLAAALRPLLAGPEGEVGRYVLCDLNGEAYRAHEWGMVQARMAAELPPIEALVHPAQSVGDTGAAITGLLIACACASFARGYAPRKVALAFVASDAGARAGLVVRPGTSLG